MATTAFSGAGSVTVYEPTKSGFPKLGAYLRELSEYRPLLWHLARSEKKADNFNTTFGRVWIILDPLLMAGVYYLVRTVIRPVSGADRSDVIAHLIVSVFFFQYAARTLARGANALIGNPGLILNASIPKAIFPLKVVLRSVLDFLWMLAVYFVLHAILQQEWGLSLLLLPVVVVLLTMFNLGLALFFGTVTVFFRDLANFLPYFTRLWLFMSPVLYTIDEIPEHLNQVLRWNPLYPFLGVVSEITDGQAVTPAWMAACVAWAVGAFTIGTVYFLRRERAVAVRL